MDNKTAIIYIKNTIQYNDLEFGSLQQLSKVISYLEQPTRKRAKVQYYHSPGGQTDIRCLECSGLIRAEYKYCPHCSAELEWPE